jgi:hypothetical protein
LVLRSAASRATCSSRSVSDSRPAALGLPGRVRGGCDSRACLLGANRPARRDGNGATGRARHEE